MVDVGPARALEVSERRDASSLPNRLDDGRAVLGCEDAGPADECVCSCFREAMRVVCFDAAVDFDECG